VSRRGVRPRACRRTGQAGEEQLDRDAYELRPSSKIFRVSRRGPVPLLRAACWRRLALAREEGQSASTIPTSPAKSPIRPLSASSSAYRPSLLRSERPINRGEGIERFVPSGASNRSGNGSSGVRMPTPPPGELTVLSNC